MKKKTIKKAVSRRKTVGVAIIAKNEEAMIGRCLESVKDADQIVVCDTGSQDKTIEIARQYTDEVYLDYIWDDDFAGAQNHCLSKMKTDWVLSIDCDEYLDVPFENVRQAIELAQNTVSVHMKAEGGHTLDFRFSRLFRRDPKIYWVQPIHKHLSIPGEGEQVGNVRIVFGHSPAHANDPDRTLRILEQAVASEPEPTRNLYYLGREYWYKQRFEDACKTLGKYVQIGYWAAEKAEAFLVLSQAYSARGMDEDARDACLQAIKINANFKEAIEWMAGICETQENARQWRRMAKTANNNDILWERVKAEPARDIIFLAPHNDDESLFGAYTLMRLRPLVIVVTDSYIQPTRGDKGCTADVRRQETIEAMKLIDCPVAFLGIKDSELTDELLTERLRHYNAETFYIPALQGGNPHHDIVNRVVMNLFGHKRVEQYTTYTKKELYTTGGWEVKPVHDEMKIKNAMLACYKSQLALRSTKPHFDAVRNKSEWLV